MHRIHSFDVAGTQFGQIFHKLRLDFIWPDRTFKMKWSQRINIDKNKENLSLLIFITSGENMLRMYWIEGSLDLKPLFTFLRSKFVLVRKRLLDGLKFNLNYQHLLKTNFWEHFKKIMKLSELDNFSLSVLVVRVSSAFSLEI